MDSILPEQRSTNTTPLHHHANNVNQFYSEQPHSFPNSIISNHSYLNSPSRPPSDTANNGGGGGGSGGNLRRVPQMYSPANNPGPSSLSGPSPVHHISGRKNRSRTESPSVQSSGGGSSNIILPSSGMVVVESNSLSPALLSHHHHHSHNNMIMHHHHHLSEPRINTSISNSSGGSGGSHSITPPNSNSNTTISCGSGNSTSANIGVPTNNNSTSSSHLNHNNNHIRKHLDSMNNSNNSRNNKSSNQQIRVKAKKCILEEDDDVEKCDKNVCGAGGRIRTSWVGPNQEFLPICDALFNVISLALYFCDIVFDILTAYTWYKVYYNSSEDELSGVFIEESSIHPESSKDKLMMWHWSIVALIFILLSAILSQVLSFKWYVQSEGRGQLGPDGVELEGPPPPCSTSVLLLLHFSFCGILWRYFKLFIPVDLRFVKNEVRDLCLLRLVHAFCEATPMLLIQLYLIWLSPSRESISDFTIVSTSLSLFSVCWALASFSKNIRKQNVHKLVLTWLGVIFQFLWHLGTVISRVVALSLYATVYGFWIFLVLVLHWFCMLMWLISPKTLYHGEKLSTSRKAMYSALIGVVYTFCYVNVQERNSRQKVILYYVTMFLENSLLLSVWLIAKRYEDEIWYKSQVIWCVFGCFGGGIFFMCLYYRYFHLKKLSYVYDASSSIYRSSSVLNGGGSLSTMSNCNGGGGAIYSTPVAKSLRKNAPRLGIELYENINEESREKSNCGSNGGSAVKNTGANLGDQIMEKGRNNKSLGLQQNSKKVPEKYAKNKQQQENKSGGGIGANNTTTTSNNGGGQRGALYNKINGHHIHHANVPGVFNCRFHPAMKRKKKKPTSFVPPPAVQTASATSTSSRREDGVEGRSNNARLNSSSTRGNNGEGIEVGATTTTPVGGNHSLEQNSRHHHNINQIRRSSSLENDCNDHDDDMCNNELGNPYSNNSDQANMIIMMGRNGGSPAGAARLSPEYSEMYGKMVSGGGGGRSLVPFWKRPLSSVTLGGGGGGSENEGSVCSRVDIQQKLQEKKKQQLAELREIEEEIKQGKLKRPKFNEILPELRTESVHHQPIPGQKKQPWFGGGSGTTGEHDEEGDSSAHPPMIIHPRPRPPFGHSSDHEVILDPQYLIYASSPSYEDFYDTPGGGGEEWPVNANGNYYEPLYQNGVIQGRLMKRKGNNINNNNRSSKESIYKSYRMPSDIDSQMSLPRSYTLPREFKYKRKFRKPLKTEQFVPSTNSSDGDVDSGEEDPEIYSQLQPYPFPLPSVHHIHTTSSKSTCNGNANGTTVIMNGTNSGTKAGGDPVAFVSTTAAIAAASGSSSAPQPSKKQPGSRRHNKLHETKL